MIKLGFPEDYRVPLALSIGLHVFLMILLSVHVPATHHAVQSAASSPPTEIVQAVAVSSKQVDAQMKAIEQRRDQQRSAEQARIKQLEAKAAAAQRARAQEQQRLAELQTKQLELKKQQEVMQKMHLEEQQKVEKLKAEQKQIMEQQQKVEKLKTEKSPVTAEKKPEQKKKEETNPLTDQTSKLQEELLKEQLAKEKQELVKTNQALNAQEQSAPSAQQQGEINELEQQILSSIRNHWFYPTDTDPNLSCIFMIDLAPDGKVLSATLTRSSGNTALDRAAETAIYKASPLPIPQDNNIFSHFRHFSLTMRP